MAAAEGQTAIWKYSSSGGGGEISCLTHLGLSVLDGQLDGDLQALPVSGGLHDVLSDLLGTETQGTDLGGQGGGGAHLSSHHAELDHSDLIGIELGRHGQLLSGSEELKLDKNGRYL